MMNLVDSSGWLEYLTKGQNGPRFLPIIRDTENLLVPTIVIYEVVKRVALLMGEEYALEIAGVMSAGQEVDLDRTLAIDGARISLDLKLSMADSLQLVQGEWQMDMPYAALALLEQAPRDRVFYRGAASNRRWFAKKKSGAT